MNIFTENSSRKNYRDMITQNHENNVHTVKQCFLMYFYIVFEILID
jgi:hypothetical protein